MYKIVEEDITGYIKSHKEQLKFNEAFFVEYMKKHDCKTEEAKIILIQKYNLMILPMDELSKRMNYLNCMMQGAPSFREIINVDFVPDFDSYNINFAGITYVLIPTLKSLGVSDSSVLECYLITQMIADQLLVDDFDGYYSERVKQVIDNYRIAGQLKIYDPTTPDFKITMSKKHCRGMLLSYEKIYGKDNVGKIKQIVKQQVKGEYYG